MNCETPDEYRMTSLELSKKFKENGCKLVSKWCWVEDTSRKWYIADREFVESLLMTKDEENHPYYPAYDILNDLCVRYAKLLFDTFIRVGKNYRIEKPDRGMATITILQLLQEDKKQEAEDYLWEHCLLNPKNKK